MRTLLLLSVLCLCSLAFTLNAQTPKPNIIFIVSDDLNDWINGLGDQPQVQTPNLDKLIHNGTLFTNAYANAPVCAPSRTSFLSGKDLFYTQVYDNNHYLSHFRDNFTAALGNEEVISMPEYLKNNGGYYTYSIDKIFHDPSTPDFDSTTTNPCLKQLSWSRYTVLREYNWIKAEEETVDDGVNGYAFGKLAESDTDDLKDARAVDSAIQFLSDIADGSISPCGGAFFLALGIDYPHLDLYLPGSYFPPYYLDDFFATPYVKPYNNPVNAWPYNGIVMPPQPDSVFGDYEMLGPVGKAIAKGQKDLETTFINFPASLPYLPEIDPLLTDAQRKAIITESEKANAVMAYIAGIQYLDAQVGRLLDALKSHPEIFHNTVIVMVGDNGFSLGEKRHWLKRSLWETDIRVPFIILDPAMPGNQICNRTVSLMDLYPTFCDMAGIGYPTFDDGSSYLDGHSLMPLLQNPSLPWERPVLVTFEAEENKDASCFPQYCVRNARFSYIRYRSDNGVLNPNFCDATTSITEEELFEVGADREVDPNEWHDLITDPAYQPVIHYLQQFLPDSSMYMQKTYTASIYVPALPCLSNATDDVKMKVRMYSPDGIPLSGAALSGFTFTWSNNLTAAISTGPNYLFHMSDIPTAVFNANQRIMFYLTVTDNTGNEVAFDTKYIYINPGNEPLASYSVNVDGSTASILDYSLSGTYNSSVWNFNDGFTTGDFIPAPHTYASPGIYKIRNIVYYGNQATCKRVFAHTISITGPPEMKSPEAACNLFPDPASDFVFISGDAIPSVKNVTVYDVTGRLLQTTKPEDAGYALRVDIHALPAGTYFIRLEGPQCNIMKQFEKL